MNRSRIQALYCLVAGTLTFFSGSVLVKANTIDSDASAESLSTEVGSRVEEVIVTAQKREENLQTTPIAISAFGGEALEDRGVGNLSELPQLVPNLLSAAGGIGIASSANYNIRGIGRTGYTMANESGVATYVDGVYLARTTGGALDLADIERVEVLRGPQGTLFGRNTTGGAVNVITVRPSFSAFTGKIDLSSGFYTDDMRPMGSARVSFNAPLSEKVAMRMVAMGRVSDGWGENNAPLRKGEALGNESTVAGKLTFLYQATDDLDLTLSADKFQRRGNAAPALQIVGPNALPEDPMKASLENASTDDINTWGTALTADWDLGAVNLKSITSYRAQDGVTAGDADGSVAPLIASYSVYDQRQVSQELQLSGELLDSRIFWVVGGYYFAEHGHFVQLSRNFGQPFYFDAANDTASNAAFGQVTAKLTDRLGLTLGLRYTSEDKEIDARTTVFGIDRLPQSHREKSYSSTNPKVGFDFQISDDLLTYVSYTQGYRSGGFNGLPTSLADLDHPFEPETNDSYEVGIKSELFDHRVRLNVAAFYSKYDDIQIGALLLVDNVLSSLTANAARANLRGLELDAQWQANRNLSLHGSLGLLDNDGLEVKPGYTVTFGGTLPQSSRINSSLGFEYRASESPYGLSFGADWSHRGSYYFNFVNSEDSKGNAYDLFNARVKIQPPEARWSLALSGKNLTNERYRWVGLSVAGMAVVAAAPTRSVALDFGYEF